MFLKTYCERCCGPVLSQEPVCLCDDAAAFAPSGPANHQQSNALLRGKYDIKSDIGRLLIYETLSFKLLNKLKEKIT